MSAENGVSSPFWSQHSSPSLTLISSFVLCTHILHATAGLGKIRIFILLQKTEFFLRGQLGPGGGGSAAALLQ